MALSAGSGEDKLMFRGIADRIRPRIDYDGWTFGYNGPVTGHVHEPVINMPVAPPIIFTHAEGGRDLDAFSGEGTYAPGAAHWGAAQQYTVGINASTFNPPGLARNPGPCIHARTLGGTVPSESMPLMGGVLAYPAQWH